MIRSRRSVVVLAGFLGLSLLSCGREVTGPENGIGYGRNRIAALALEPTFPVIPGAKAISDVVPFSRVRITLRRIDGSIAKDTTVEFPVGVDSVTLAIDVPLPVTAPDSGLSLGLRLAYINAAGDTVFRGGPLAVTARPSGSAGSTQTVSIPVSWVPPGGVAPATVTLTPATGAVVAGTTTQLTAVVRDAQGNALPGTPVLFFSPDTTRAVLSSPGSGLVTWRAVRGNALLVATTPNLVADTSTFLVSLPAARLLPVSGGAQSTTINTALSAPVVLRVTASDSVPVAGIPVSFAVTAGGGTLLASADTSDASGLVQFSWTMGALVGTQSVTATLSTNAATLATTATGTAPLPTQLAITAAPTTATAGATFTPVTVEVRDADGLRASLFTGPVTVALDAGATGATLAGTTTVNAVAGVATFGTLSIERAATGLTLVATSAGLTPDTSAAFTITAAAAAQIAALSGGGQSGAVLTPLAAPYVVRVTDAFGNPVAGTSVSWAVTGGTGTLSAASSTTNAGGEASTTLTLGTTLGSVTVGATATGLTGSPVFFTATALEGAPTQLLFTQSITSAEAGSVNEWIVQVRDAAGNVVTNFNGVVSVALTGGAPTAVLGGTTSVNAVAGFAHFNTLTVDLVATGYRLVASSAGLPDAQSALFTITNAAAATIAAQSGSGQVSPIVTALAQPFVVRVTDAFANPVAGVTVTWATSVGGGALSATTSVTDAAGLASTTYTTGTVPGTAVVTGTAAGLSGSPVSFSTTVTAGAVSQLVFAQQPGSYVAAQTGAPVIIEARDGSGNLTPTFTGAVTVSVLSGPPGAVLGVTRVVSAVGGVVTLTDLTFNLAGSYTLGATAGGLADATSAAFAVTAGAPTAIASIGGAGQTGAVSAPLADSLAFRVTDALGNPTAGVALTVTISLGGGSVSPATGVTNAAGEFRTAWTLGPVLGTQSLVTEVDVQPGLLVAVTGEAVAGPATTLAITSGTIPTAVAGVNVPNVVLEARDAAGNLATTFNTPVWGHVDASPDGPYPDSVSAVTVNGVAVFDFINFSRAGTYQLRFSAAGLADAQPNAFQVIAGPAAFISPDTIASGDGQSATVGTALALPLRAHVTDTESNGIAGVAVTFTMRRGVDTLATNNVTTDATGFASFIPTLPATQGPVEFVISSTGLTGSGFSYSATATAGAAVRVAITQQPGNATSGTPIPPVTVVAHDALGNLVTAFTGTIDVVVDSGPVAGWSLGGTQAIAAVAGEATFGDLTLDRASQYRLRVRSAGLDSAISAPFTIGAGAPAAITAVEGNGQTAAASFALADSLGARLTDAFGNPIVGTTVTWSITTGGGTIAPPTSVTGADGIARAAWTLGAVTGAQGARADAPGMNATFGATATVNDANIAWTGAVNTTWSVAGNWSGGAVPTATDSVRIGIAGNIPTLDVQGIVARLRIEPGATLRLDTFPLFVGGTLDVDATASILSDSLGGFALIGTSGTVRGPMPRLFVQAGAYTLNGALNVAGDLMIMGGALEISSFAATVGGNFTTTGAGTFAMTGGGALDVLGDAIFAGGSTAGLLTSGAMSVHGDFTQGGGSPQAFSASAGHLLRLDGPATQALHLLDPDLQLNTSCATSCFGTLRSERAAGTGALQVLSGIKALGTIVVSGDSLVAPGERLISAGTPSITSDVVIAGAIGWQDALIRTAGTFAVDTLVAWGAGTLLVGEVIPTVVTGNYSVTGAHPAAIVVDGPNGLLAINGATTVGSGGLAFATRGNGRLLMQEVSDTLTVNGDADFAGTTAANTLTNGLLAIGGAFTMTNSSADAFIAEGAHRTRLFAANPSVSFARIGGNQFAHLDIDATGAMTFDGNATIAGTVKLGSGTSVVGGGLITIGGDLIDSLGTRWQATETFFQANDPVIPHQFLGSAVFLGGVTFDTSMTFGANLEIRSGFLDLNGHAVSVSGDFETRDSGVLRMMSPSDTLIVAGTARFRGNPTAGQMMNGLLELHGPLVQLTNAEAFAPGGAHQTWFRGAVTQPVSLANSGTGAGTSHFATVGLGQTAPGVSVLLQSDAFAEGMLLTESAASLRLSSASNLAITSLGAGVAGGLEFDNVRWILNDGAPVDPIFNVSFINTDATAVALSVTRSGGVIALDNPVFGTTPTSGLYLRAEDPDGAAGGALDISVTNPTPVAHGGFADAIAPATISNWGVGGFDWTGVTSGDWSVAANWLQGQVPGAADSVRIPVAGVTNMPTLLSPVTVRALVNDNALPITVDAGATLTIVEDAVLRGDVSGITCLSGAVEIGTGSPVAATLQGRIDCSVNVTALQNALDGPTTIGGAANAFTVASGTDFMINGQKMVVAGTFFTQGTGRLQMMSAQDSLDVGNADFSGGPTTGVLSNGDFVVRGDLSANVGPNRFDASGAHRTRFLPGIGDTATVAANGGQMNFGQLEVLRPIRLSGPSRVLGNALVASGAAVVGLGGITIDGDLTGATGTLVAPQRFQISGVLADTGTFRPDTTIFSGPAQVLPFRVGAIAIPQYQVVRIVGTVTAGLTGGIDSVGTDLIIDGGTFLVDDAVNVADLRIGRDLRVINGGLLSSSVLAHQFLVLRHALFDGRDATGALALGTLTVRGDFTQLATTFATSFAPAPTFTVALDSLGTVSFATPGPSRFGRLAFNASGGERTLLTDVEVAGEVAFNPDGGATVRSDVLGAGGTRQLAANGASQGGSMTFRNVRLRLQGTDPVSLTQTFTFSDFDPDVVQLAVARPGGVVTVFDPIFTTTPTGSGRYLHATDTDLGNADDLQVVISGTPTPAFHAGRAEAVLPATLAGWAAAAIFRWTGGATTSDWATPANWLNGVVPSATDSVFVPGALLYNPVIPAATTLRAFVSERTETPITAAGAFAITERLVVPTTGGLSCSGQLTFSNAVTPMNASGLVACFTRVLDGTVTASDTLLIAGANDLQVEGASILDAGADFVTVSGFFSTLATGVLRMQDDSAHVWMQQGASFGGGSTAGLLTAGRLEIGGNFTQSGDAESFAASGTHLTEFMGNVSQGATFSAPGTSAGSSHFNHLALGQTEAGVSVALATDAYAIGQLRSGTGTVRTLSTVAGAAFFSGGANIANASFDGVRWSLLDGAPVDGISGIAFTNQDVAAPQFSVTRTTGTVSATGLVFSTAPTTGVYLRAEDPDGATNGSLIVSLAGTTPGGHGGFIAEINTATITGWSTIEPFVWTGSLDTDWNNTANWAGGNVPSASDSVTISASALVGPDINAPTTIRALVNESATVAVTLQSQSLTITERLVTLHGAPGVACVDSPFLTIAPTTAATVAGHVACDVAIGGAGLTSLTDSLLLGRSLRVGASGTLELNGRTVRVLDSLVVEANGSLRLDDATSLLDVTRDASFRGANLGFLTSGRLRVGGDFSQSVVADAFAASGLTIELHDAFAGAEGTPTVSFADPLNSHFGSLVLGDGARQLLTPVRVQQDALFGTTGSVTGAGALTVLGTLSDTMTYGATPPTLTLPMLWVEGTFEYRGTIAADTVYLGGTAIERPLPASILGTRVPYQTLIVGGPRAVTVASATDTLVTTGKLIVNSTGTLRFAAAGATAVTLVGDTLRSGGSLILDQPGATVIATNGADLQGTSTVTDGLLRLGGETIIHPGAFNPSGLHVTELFDGNAVTDVFALTMLDSTSSFGRLRLTSGTWSLGGAADTVLVTTSLDVAGSSLLDGDAFVKVSGDVLGQSGATLSLTNLTYGGDWQFPGTFAVDTLTLAGATPQSLHARDALAAVIPYNVVRVTGDARPVVGPSEDLMIGNTLLIDGGTFRLGTAANGTDSVRVQVNGALRTLNGGVLEMIHAEGRMTVNGVADFAGGSTDGRLTTGELVLQGDFAQSGGASDAFRPTGVHLTRFSTEGTQTVTFAVPGANPGESSFRRMRIAQAPDSRVTLLSDAFVTDQLTEQMTARARIRADVAHVLAVGGANLDSVRFDRVALHVLNGANVEGMMTLTFDSLPSNTSQLVIQRDGGAIALDDLTFGVVPDLGNHYIDATDLNTGDADPLTINITGVTPGGHGGRITTAGGAVINGWGQFGDATWTGALTNDWNDPGNWVGGIVPDANTNVNVPTSVNDPVISDQRTINTLVVAAGATLTLFPGDTLTLTGNATIAGTIAVSTPNDPSSVLRLAAPGISSLAAPGEIGAKLLIASGSIALIDSVRVTHDQSTSVDVAGGTLDLNQRRMDVVGSFRTSGSGQLQMLAAADSLVLGADAEFAGGTTDGLLTNGTVLVGRDFRQLGAGSVTSFAATGSHLVRFVGAASDAVVDFGTAGATLSRFANVGLDKPDGRTLTFLNTVAQVGNIVSNTGPVIVNNAGVNVSGTVAQPGASGAWDVGPTASVVLAGVNPTTCDGALFVVTNTPANFTPTACWNPPATELAWTGGGGNSLWSNPANWSLNRIPVASDSVTIDQSATVDLNEAATVSWLIMGLTSSPTLNLNNGATLQVDSAALTTATATLNMVGGSTLTGDGAVSLAGPFNWNGGTMSGAGGTLVAVGGTAAIATAQTVTLAARTLAIAGSATIGAGGLSSSGAPVISVIAGGTLDFPATASYFIASGDVTLQNAGTVRKLASAGTVRLEWPVINTGTIQVQDETLDLRNTLTHLPGGTIDIAAGATLLDLGTITASTGSAITVGDGGLLQLQGGGVNANPGNHDFAAGSSITGQGTLRTINADTVTIAGTVNIDSLLTGAGRIELNSADTVNIGGGAYQGGGFFSGSAVVAISGTFTVAAGNMNGTGTIHVRPLATLQTVTATFRGWDVDVGGTWTWGDGDLGLTFDPATSDTSFVRIRTGGVFDLQHQATARSLFGYAGLGITNEGILRKSSGAATTTFFGGLQVANIGSIDVVLGVLTIQAGCTISGGVTGAGTLNGIGCIN